VRRLREGLMLYRVGAGLASVCSLTPHTSITTPPSPPPPPNYSTLSWPRSKPVTIDFG